MTTSSKPQAVLLAQIALIGAGTLWALGGLFVYGFVSPTKGEDGTYWDMIDPISIERAGQLRTEAAMLLALGVAVAVMHFVAAAVSWKRTWGRWVMLTIGLLYCVSAVPLSVGAVREFSSALPVYAAISALLGLCLLNGFRRTSARSYPAETEPQEQLR